MDGARSGSPGYGELLGVGAAAAAAIIIGMGLGWLADTIAGTGPILLFVGLVVGIAGAVRFAMIRFRPYLRPTPPTDRS